GRSPGNSGGLSTSRSDRTYPTQRQGFLFDCELDHRTMCSSILGCRHVPDSGGEDVTSFGGSGAEHFDGMVQECVRWLPGCIGPGIVADPGSVTTVHGLRS